MATTFEYSVRDRDGKVSKGRVEGDSKAMVAEKLKTMGYNPLTLDEVKTTGPNKQISFGGQKRVKLKELSIFARQFATMINSGLSLLRSLSILEEQTENKTFATVVGKVRTEVEGGSSLSAAMAKHPTVFPPIMIHMTRAGEVGGFLDKVKSQLAANFEAEVRLHGKIKSAMTYPVSCSCGGGGAGDVRDAAVHRAGVRLDVRQPRRHVAAADAHPGVAVRRGEPLARPLAHHPVFPPMVVQMMSVGEDTGALDLMLGKIAGFYDAEVEATTESLTSLIEPLMIAVVGGMIGAMIIALYMPIFKVFDLIQ